MNHCCYCFDGLQRMKTKYIVLCVNALAKYQNARGASRHLVFMVNYRTFSFMPWPYQFINRLLSVCSRSCAGHEILWPRERCLCLEKKVDMKCMQPQKYRKKRSQKYRKDDKEIVYSYHVTYPF